MGREYTEAQKRASLEYQKSKSRVQVWLTPEQKTKYQSYAQSKDLKLSELVVNALEAYINKESGK